MKPIVVVERPPVYDRCVDVFGKAAIVGKPILWSWGDRIYNPEDVDIPPELFAHEAAHAAQQGTEEKGIRRWWDNYLRDPKFRFEEEVLGHRAEWFNYVRRHPGHNCGPVLEAMAKRLAGDLYGNMVPLDIARATLLVRA
jgi:hypothetical protein